MKPLFTDITTEELDGEEPTSIIVSMACDQQSDALDQYLTELMFYPVDD